MITAETTQTSIFAGNSVASFFILAMILGTGTLSLGELGILPAGVALSSALSASIAGESSWPL